MAHPLLNRQLRRLGLTFDRPPADPAAWRSFLEHVGKAYREADEERYLLERSLRLSSSEMQELNDSLRRDLGERRRIQDALERERGQLLSIIRGAPIPIAMFDTEMRYVAHSARWVEDYELDQPDLSGRSHYEVFPDIPERWRAIHRRALAGEVVTQPEDVFERDDGRRLFLRWAIHPWYTPEGTVGGIVMVTERIDELVQAREAALETARLKSEFLANVSHEIRTPVNVILGMTEMLLDQALDTQQRDFAETIRGSAVILLDLLNDVLDFSKLEAGRVELERIDLDPRSILEDAIDLFAEAAHRKDLEIACYAAPDLPERVCGDAGLLRRVLLNMIANAVKFTDRGEIVASVRVETASPAEVLLRFVVRDTGLGIPPAAQSRIFEAFVQADGSMTRRYGGTGLGLAICKQLVTALGGTIGVESAPGCGSVFWFTASFAPVAADDAAADPTVFESQRVLVTARNAAQRDILRRQLASWGLRVEVASDAADAIALLRDATAAGERFAAALLERDLPDIDGLSLARVVRDDAALAETRLVLLTSRIHRPSERETQLAGFDASLTKPVRERKLRATVAALLAASRRAVGEDRDADAAAAPRRAGAGIR